MFIGLPEEHFLATIPTVHFCCNPSMAKRKNRSFPGTLYQRGDRWWWRVRLHGETKKKAYALKPPGAKFATKDLKTAESLAADIWKRSALRTESGSQLDGSIASLVATYQDYAKSYYRSPTGKLTSQYGCITSATNMLSEQFGGALAEDFTPLDLATFRSYLVALKRKDGEGRLARTVVNKYISLVKGCFKWGASQMLLPASTYHALQTVVGLKAGRSDARETEEVKAVDVVFVNRMLPYCPPTVAAMVELQHYTAMRSGEMVVMRPMDIDTSGKVWFYEPDHHKTRHHGHVRRAHFGPKAQKILQPFLNRRVDLPCFSPKEAMEQMRQKAEAARKTPKGQGNTRGSNRKANPKKQPGDAYTTDSYRNAVLAAIERANADDKKVQRFTPHRLRHTAATRIRKEIGLDAARAVLGERSLGMADEYAEIDAKLAENAMAKFG
jgi:integrase